MAGTETDRDLITLAVTKRRAPTLGPNVIGRPRINDLLNASVDSPQSLALLSAPAGSGKSTTLASWLTSRPDLRSTWFQVDETDNDPIRFWSGVVSALSLVDEAIAHEVIPVLRAPGTSFPDGALPVLINALDRVGRVAMVFDDYHLIDNAEIHHGMQQLIDFAPDELTVIISTRFDPPLRVGRLRVQGLLTEIRSNDLRFDCHEASPFFDGELTPDHVNVLCERTEGWAAGLALAAASMARSEDVDSFVRSFAGDDRLMVDYFASELLARLSEETREVMLTTAILEQMCGPLVDAISDITYGADWLNTHAHENQLLVSLDGHGHWYRYHHLLSEFLMSELERASPERLGELHRRAASWYEANDLPDSAIRHWFLADDREAAADLVGVRGTRVFSDGQLTTVQRWLNRLGPRLVSTHPSCCVLQVWTMLIAGDFEDVDQWIQTAETLLQDAEAPQLSGSIAAAGCVAAIQKGDVGRAAAAAEAIAAIADGKEMTSLVSSIVGICRTWSGRLDSAVPILESSARSAPAEGEHLTECISTMFLGIVALEDGDRGRALHSAARSIELAREHHLTEYHQVALAHSVLASASEEIDPASAQPHADRGVLLARRSPTPIVLAYALATRAEVAMVDGRHDAAATDLAESRALLDRCPDPGLVLTFVARREARLRQPQRPLVRGPQTGLIDELTERELVILRLLPSKLTVREIAGELSNSQNTIKGHIKAIYRKLGVNERPLAIQRARELHLL